MLKIKGLKRYHISWGQAHSMGALAEVVQLLNPGKVDGRHKKPAITLYPCAEVGVQGALLCALGIRQSGTNCQNGLKLDGIRSWTIASPRRRQGCRRVM